MKNIKTILIALLFFTILVNAKAQFVNNLANGDVVIGIGWNVVEDNGEPFKNLFDIEDSWNTVSYPSTLRAEKGFTKSFSFVFAASYNKYEANKKINNEFQYKSSTFYSLDFGVKYNFLNAASEKIDLYGVMGAGATHRETYTTGNAGTINLGVGMNAYIYKDFGINIDAATKFGVDDFWSTNVNYLQYSIGLIYKLHSAGKYYKSK